MTLCEKALEKTLNLALSMLLEPCKIALQMLQLYSALDLKQGIILTGISATGKTTIYKVLSEVLTRLHSKDGEKTDEDFVPERSLTAASNRKLGVKN